MVKQSTEILTEVRRDGETDAVVVRIANTGLSGAAADDRYRHQIVHGLGRTPVGCQVILKDRDCDVFVLNSDANQIDVRFTAAEAAVNVRIW